MKRIAVIDIVGLSSSIIGRHTPFIQKFIKQNKLHHIKPVLPAVTTSAQTTYLTGLTPSQHGIVGNGWYDHIDSEIKFWKQSNKLVQGESIWHTAKKINPAFTCAQMFWWYNMYNDADFSVTPRPNYLADGSKLPDCYTYPDTLRDELTQKYGKFPLFNFWGPNANIKSSAWIANSAMYVEEKYQPTLNLIYLPHLDYCLQKFGPQSLEIEQDLEQIDSLVSQLVIFFESRNIEVIILSEYGISPVDNPIHINRILRKEGFLNIRIERNLEFLDAGASDAFAVSDHQIAHIYCKTGEVQNRVKTLIRKIPGVANVFDKEEQKKYHINHKRSGDLVVLATENSWFTYYFWLDDSLAPDYARVVDIHRKPGYDPVEMFITSKSKALVKLLFKKIGFRSILDVIPLDASLVKGSHGINETNQNYYPVLITNTVLTKDIVDATSIKGLILDKIFSK